jgi:hypothetical protein
MSHFLHLTYMLMRGSSEETLVCVICEWPYVDHNNVIFCEAVNIEGRQKIKSTEKSIYIQCKYIYIYTMYLKKPDGRPHASNPRYQQWKWRLCCLIGLVLSSNMPLYPGSRTTGVCSTYKCLRLSFYNIYYIVVTSWSDCHCCHWYCNINNNNYQPSLPLCLPADSIGQCLLILLTRQFPIWYMF